MVYSAKVYEIRCSHCDKKYVGSTCDKKGLRNRFYNHRADCNRGKPSTLYNHMREVGQDKFSIHLLETFEVADFDEQRQKEQQYIDSLNTFKDGLNHQFAYQTLERLREIQHKVYLKQKAKPEYRQKENTYRNKLRADTPKDTHKCATCDYNTNRLDTYKRHLKGKWHLDRVQRATEI